MKAQNAIFDWMAASLLVAASTTFADVQPAGNPTATRQAIQAAIDAAAPTAGTVTLAAGLFEIDAQLLVTNGVSLVGQGWDGTIIKQTATDRVATLKDGSKIEGVVLTGGSVNGNWEMGGGAKVENGIVSRCCITNNAADGGNNKYGGGVFIAQGQIDHCIIANNIARTTAADVAVGGGIGIRNPTGGVTIDSCLIAGNRAFTTGSHVGQGGGIGVEYNPNNGNVVKVRNVTVVGNMAGDAATQNVSKGGAVYTAYPSGSAKQGTFVLLDSVISDNTTVNTNISVNLVSGGEADYCLFDIEDDTVGGHSLYGQPAFIDAANNDYHLGSSSPAIQAGVAYEDLAADLDNVPFARPPSMGCYEYVEPAENPAFDPAPGSTFFPSASVTLSCATQGASIHYTTDGSVPTDSSTPYTEPIDLSATTTIKARAFAAGKRPSGVVSATYTRKRPVPKPSAFKKSVEITLATDALAGIPSGVPALVRLDESAIVGFDYGDFTLPNGGDLMFFDENGTPLPHEVDTWDENGESLVWVKLASTAENTKIFMYYGNGTVSSEEPEDVWTDYVGVWHFEEATAATTAYSYGTYANSTATTGIDGNIAQYAVPNEPGRFGKGFRVNDSTGMKAGNYNYGGVWVNDSGANSPVDGGQNFTISGWFKHDSYAYFYDHFFYKRKRSDNTQTPNNAFAIEANSNGGSNPQIFARGSSSTGGRVLNENDGLYGKWAYVTFVYDGAQCRVYENGVHKEDATIAACIDNDSPLVLGNNCDVASGNVGDAAWGGWIDEVRYSAGSKSAAWVAAEYAAMNVSATDIFVYGAATSVQSSGAVISVR